MVNVLKPEPPLHAGLSHDDFQGVQLVIVHASEHLVSTYSCVLHIFGSPPTQYWLACKGGAGRIQKPTSKGKCTIFFSPGSKLV